ncbi:MAG: DUF2066 domain-containing protein [Rhizobiales bacterium]|nr:DUF2066 domain-containing protein [Hyphomicrobiales bacterium]
MKSAIAILLAAGFLFTAGTTKAEAADIYRVSGVHVDETAASATEARNTAQAKGQSKALGILLRRLTLPEDWANLPAADADFTQRAVSSFQINNEKASSTRYIADLSVAFQPAVVKGALAARGISFGEVQAKPTLLVAVFEKPGLRVFWEDPNPWRDAWNRLDLGNAMTPVILPLGDIEEFGMLTTAQAVSGDRAALSAMAARYGASDVLVAYATADASGTNVTVSLKDYQGEDAPVTGSKSYSGATLEDTLDAAAAGTLDDLSLAWKRSTIVRGGAGGKLLAEARFSSLGEWQAIRNALSSTPYVAEMDVHGISADGAEVAITYKGDAAKLAQSLADKNVALAESETGWSLTSGVAPTLVEPVSEPGDPDTATMTP